VGSCLGFLRFRLGYHTERTNREGFDSNGGSGRIMDEWFFRPPSSGAHPAHFLEERHERYLKGLGVLVSSAPFGAVLVRWRGHPVRVVATIPTSSRWPKLAVLVEVESLTRGTQNFMRPK
jgi:hypothetical protein